MQLKYSFIIAGLILGGCASFDGQDTAIETENTNVFASDPISDSVEETFLYTNEFGEELFGDLYEPQVATDLGLELEVGRADGGLRPGELYKLVSHDEVAKQIQTETFKVTPNDIGAFNVNVPPLPRSPDTTPVDDEMIAWPIESLAQATQIMSTSFVEQEMFVHFVDVGQGDGAILEFPCGVAVIDTGGQFGGGPNGGIEFVRYLDRFFDQRPQLNKTIDVLFTTHPHFDHLRGLEYMVGSDGKPLYTIRNVVDNGQEGTKGSLGRQTRFRDAAKAQGAAYTGVHVGRLYNALGATNTAIDPFDCKQAGIDPVITAYWGGWDRASIRALGGDATGFSNANNHSLILRVDFGAASFLFSGDLEDTGLEHVLRLYDNNLGIFDVDVYQVSHHGADNDTSDRLIELMSPEIAVISMGHPYDPGSSSARAHGHPRTNVVKLMQEDPFVVSQEREKPVEYWSYSGAKRDHEPMIVNRGIYGTGWEGDLVLRATSKGDYQFLDSTRPGS